MMSIYDCLKQLSRETSSYLVPCKLFNNLTNSRSYVFLDFLNLFIPISVANPNCSYDELVELTCKEIQRGLNKLNIYYKDIKLVLFVDTGYNQIKMKQQRSKNTAISISVYKQLYGSATVGCVNTHTVRNFDVAKYDVVKCDSFDAEEAMCKVCINSNCIYWSNDYDTCVFGLLSNSPNEKTYFMDNILYKLRLSKPELIKYIYANYPSHFFPFIFA